MQGTWRRQPQLHDARKREKLNRVATRVLHRRAAASPTKGLKEGRVISKVVESLIVWSVLNSERG